MTAKRGPVPRQGILDIAPYVPGTSALPGTHAVIKLSSNETPFGPSPAAIEAYLAAASSLSLYPDGSAKPVREALAKLYGLDAERIVCGAGSDELLNLIAGSLSRPGRRGDLQRARLPRLQDRHPRARRQARRRAGERSHHQCRRDPRPGDAADARGVHRQPQQPDRHLSFLR